jgi:hypothetical protein
LFLWIKHARVRAIHAATHEAVNCFGWNTNHEWVNLDDLRNDSFTGAFSRTGVVFSLGAVGMCAQAIFSIDRFSASEKLRWPSFLVLAITFALSAQVLLSRLLSSSPALTRFCAPLQ